MKRNSIRLLLGSFIMLAGYSSTISLAMEQSEQDNDFPVELWRDGKLVGSINGIINKNSVELTEVRLEFAHKNQDNEDCLFNHFKQQVQHSFPHVQTLYARGQERQGSPRMMSKAEMEEQDRLFNQFAAKKEAILKLLERHGGVRDIQTNRVTLDLASNKASEQSSPEKAVSSLLTAKRVAAGIMAVGTLYMAVRHRTTMATCFKNLADKASWLYAKMPALRR